MSGPDGAGAPRVVGETPGLQAWMDKAYERARHDGSPRAHRHPEPDESDDLFPATFAAEEVIREDEVYAAVESILKQPVERGTLPPSPDTVPPGDRPVNKNSSLGHKLVHKLGIRH